MHFAVSMCLHRDEWLGKYLNAAHGNVRKADSGMMMPAVVKLSGKFCGWVEPWYFDYSTWQWKERPFDIKSDGFDGQIEAIAELLIKSKITWCVRTVVRCT
jgi:hypothetical protein